MDFWKDFFVPIAAAAIGTAAGATVAFVIERGKRKRDAEDRDVTATNNALFALFKIFNDLEAYRRQAIAPHLNDPDRWYSLPPMLLPDQIKFDTSTLSYLMELPGDAPTLSMAVHVGLGMYDQAADAARFRHDLHVNTVQPALERGARLSGIPAIKDRVDTVLGGSRVTDSMRSITDQLIQLVAGALDYIPKHAVWLRDVAKTRYPRRQIVQLLIRPPE
jgi:hypothetical protein